MRIHATALIAEDEPLLRDALRRQLANVWPELEIVAEAAVRIPLKQLLEQLDSDQFAQVHRSVVVNLRAISHVRRHDSETAEIHLKGRGRCSRRSSARIRASSQSGCPARTDAARLFRMLLAIHVAAAGP
jgi:DNA-binding LytR/AlgR family response regulator